MNHDEEIDELLRRGFPLGEAISRVFDPDPAGVTDEKIGMEAA